MAITAAETGHIVLGTINTQGAVRAIDRLVNFFGGDEQQQVRTMLADTLRGVISQQLVWRKDGLGRVAAVEVLLGDYRTAKLIRDNKSYQIPNIMSMGTDKGMQTMDQALLTLLDRDAITPEEAYRKAVDRAQFEPYFESGEVPRDVRPSREMNEHVAAEA
jgi:twitching motility protein PilT